MKTTSLLVIFLLSFTLLSAQNQSDTIEVKQMMGPVFRLNGKNLTPRQLLDLTKNNSAAHKEMQTAKSNYDVGNVFGSVGGFLIGWPIGTALGGGKPNWTLAGIGAGLVVISVPFSIASSKHAKNAVRTYNSGLRLSGMSTTQCRLGLSNNGINFKIVF
jgi:hypothetical protein